ncbi:MAG: ABC transporter substrate-binding protein [Bacteroidales bacterium]|nr:ABC transporter substrate-binding protein [Bacteroidales bacterium]
MKHFFFCIILLTFGFNTNAIERIVSLTPSLTMNIYYLGLQDKLVGCTSYCHIAKNDYKQIVGSAKLVNIEKVFSLKPDLVLVSSITSPETIAKLRKLGLRVEVFPTPQSFDILCSQFIKIGEITNTKSLAEKIIKETKSAIKTIETATNSHKKHKVFFQIGANPLYAVIPNTFMDDYLKFLNTTNIAADLSIGNISRESVLQRNPDIIIIVTMGIVGKDEIAQWKKFPNISAVKSNKIFVIDSNMACTPTPKSFLETLQLLYSFIK